MQGLMWRLCLLLYVLGEEDDERVVSKVVKWCCLEVMSVVWVINCNKCIIMLLLLGLMLLLV